MMAILADELDVLAQEVLDSGDDIPFLRRRVRNAGYAVQRYARIVDVVAFDPVIANVRDSFFLELPVELVEPAPPFELLAESGGIAFSIGHVLVFERYRISERHEAERPVDPEPGHPVAAL